ncbi:MAG: hypothetical protein [Enterobacter phage ENC20]|nr:MAG: hypothetical protein [Enterobacter phage ENC20]
MHSRYDEYFGANPRYSHLLRMLGMKYIISTSDEAGEPSAVCLTIMKGAWHSSRTWSFFMLDTLDDDTLSYSIDSSVVQLITELCERILNETKLQKN